MELGMTGNTTGNNYRRAFSALARLSEHPRRVPGVASVLDDIALAAQSMANIQMAPTSPGAAAARWYRPTTGAPFSVASAGLSRIVRCGNSDLLEVAADALEAAADAADDGEAAQQMRAVFAAAGWEPVPVA